MVSLLKELSQLEVEPLDIIEISSREQDKSLDSLVTVEEQTDGAPGLIVKVTLVPLIFDDDKNECLTYGAVVVVESGRSRRRTG